MRKLCCLVLVAIVTGCASQAGKTEQTAAPAGTAPAARTTSGASAPTAPSSTSGAAAAASTGQGLYPSTYKVPASSPTLIRHATVLTGTGTRLDGADVLLVDGKIQAVGTNVQAPANARVVEGDGLWVTPGLIDVHSHLGVYASPQVQANSDGNEATSPSTANVWSEHSVWPQDPGFRTALAGGITTLQILPGSANLIGGRSVVLKNVPSVTYQGMKFPGAPQGLKMA